MSTFRSSRRILFTLFRWRPPESLLYFPVSLLPPLGRMEALAVCSVCWAPCGQSTHVSIFHPSEVLLASFSESEWAQSTPVVQSLHLNSPKDPESISAPSIDGLLSLPVSLSSCVLRTLFLWNCYRCYDRFWLRSGSICPFGAVLDVGLLIHFLP